MTVAKIQYHTMGCGQVVRRLILAQEILGSNPSTPAINKTGDISGFINGLSIGTRAVPCSGGSVNEENEKKARSIFFSLTK